MSAEMEKGLELVCQSAKKRGLKFDVLAVEKKTTSISFQNRKLDQFSFSETRQMGVRIFDGQHEGVAYTENLQPDAIEQMLNQAEANARWIERDFLSTLPGPQKFEDLKGIADPALAHVTSEEKIKTAALLESAALDHDSRITSVAYTRYSDHDSQVWVANSQGLSGTYRTLSTMGYAHCLAADPKGNAMAGDMEVQRSFAALNAERVAKSAAEKTVKRLGAERPKTGRYTVVIENRAAEQLLGAIADYFSAKAVDEKTSALTGKLGQKIFSPCLTLIDNPLDVSAPGCRPFDEEGYPCQITTLIHEGRVENFLTNSALAKKMRLPHTASAQRSPATDLDAGATTLFLKPGTQSFADLIHSDHSVILITDLLGMAGFRAASGDFSIPVQGFQYQNGQQTLALKDFLISGNILELLNTVEAVGNDVQRPVSGTVCPSLLIREVNISGQT